MIPYKISPIHIAVIGLVSLSSAACQNRTILHDVDTVSKMTNIDSVPDANKDVKVWFVKMTNDELALTPVERNLGGGDHLANAVQQLLEGPSSSEASTGLASEIPRGTLLLGVKHEGEDIELNLSKRFASAGGGTSLETRIEQLRRTVTNLAGSRKVYLDIEGERLSTTTGDGLEIKQPIN